MHQVALAVSGALLGINALQDFRQREILLWPTVAVGLAGIFHRFHMQSFHPELLLIDLFPGIFLSFFSLVTGGKIGLGDGILLLAFGCWCSCGLTWRMIFFALLLAAGAGMVQAIHQKESRWKEIELPMVPFFFAGYLLILGTVS